MDLVDSTVIPEQKENSTSVNDSQKAIADKLGLDVSRTTRKGWMITTCPFCGKKDKFGVRFNDDKRFIQYSSKTHKNKVSFNCYRGKCGESGATNKLLIKLELEYLINQKDFVKEIDVIDFEKEEGLEPDITTDIVRPPIGYKRVSTNKYLVDRRFEPWQFEKYHIGESILLGMKNRVIFLIMEDGENRGSIARSTLSKEMQEKYDIIKYKNEEVDFEKLLFGIDEINEGDNVIAVEGVTDKAAIDRTLNVLDLDNWKCVCTFGKKISTVQLIKLRNKNISELVFMYDDDAVTESKKYSFDADNYIEKVRVARIVNGDPDDLSVMDFLEIMESRQTPTSFSVNVVKRRKLNG